MQVLDAATSGSQRGGPSFPLSNRIRRAIWSLVWLLLARWTPPPLHAWRVLVLRLFGARIGPRCRIYGSTRVWDPANLELGGNVLIGPGAIVYNQGHIAIGSDSVISQRAHLCASSHRIGDRHFQLVLKPIAIGARCWVAAEAFVGPGVTMAEGAVLGARGALFEDAEGYTVYRGNPAVVVANRRFAAGEDAEA
jgi:putative colanic acid biosynthesis acetyltransferase WcaF